MKRIVWIFFLLIAGLGACTPPENGKSIDDKGLTIKPMSYEPILLLDEAHNALWQDSAQPFVMRPYAALVLDLQDYVFHIPSAMNQAQIQAKFDNPGPIDGPNVVHVLCQDDVFVAKWAPQNGRIRLDASVLSKGQNGKTFSEFKDRDLVYLMIGYQGNRAPGEKEAPFAPFYSARILVDQHPLRFTR